MHYIYSAAFTLEENGKYYARIPDLPGCISSGKTLEEAIEMITDAASLYLVSAEDHGEAIPEPSPQSALHAEENQFFSLVQIDTLAYRAATDNRAVRKNVSIPAWMATLAEKRGISLSQALQDSLMARL